MILNLLLKIKIGAFKDCSSLTQITLPSSLNNFNASIFIGCTNLDKILINQTEDVKLNLFEDKYLLLKSDSSKDYDVFVWVRPNIEKITVPLSVKKIGDYAFYGCSSLTQVKLPSSVIEIGECTFDYCTSLSQLELPSSLTKIGDYAFCNCFMLKELEIPSSVTEVGFGSFHYEKKYHL